MRMASAGAVLDPSTHGSIDMTLFGGDLAAKCGPTEYRFLLVTPTV
jgi:hypothetical protein